MTSKDTKASSRWVERGLGLAIGCVMMSVALPTARPVGDSEQARATVRGVRDLLVMARDAATQTGRQHVVFFEQDRSGAPIVDRAGEPVMALLARDVGQDDMVVSLEYVASIPFSESIGITWGATSARIPAPGDLTHALDNPWTFLQPDGRAEASWLSFRADGSPRAVAAASSLVGAPGSGAGAIYLRGPRRDYAVVVSPSGAIEEHSWSPGDHAWARGTIR